MSLTFTQILNNSITFKEYFGIDKIEIGAMEPLLWKDEDKNIIDLISGLTNSGFEVSMTTNGTLLHKYVEELENSGLKKIRVSWPSFKSDIFNSITGASHKQFLKGVESLLTSNLDFKFNRILLKGYLDDLRDHLTWIRNNGCRIKLHDLYWTKSNASVYNNYFISAQEAIKNNLSDLIINNEIYGTEKRKRHLFFLSKESYFEIKFMPYRNFSQCMNCVNKDFCLEGFTEYLRIDSSEKIQPCYLRDDLCLTFKNFEDFKRNSESLWNVPFDVLKESKIVFTITNRCNHKCVFPKSNIAWCLIHN